MKSITTWICRVACVSALVVGGVAVTAIAPHSQTATGDGGGVDPSTVGMFSGFNKTEHRAEVQQQLGRTFAWQVIMADRTNPSKMRSSVRGQIIGPGDLESVAAQQSLVVTVPLAFGTGSAKSAAGRREIRNKLNETARGTWDADFRYVAENLAFNGYPDAVIRLGHEFTGSWYPWSAQGNAQQYINAWRQIHRVFREVSPDFRFEWNAARNTFGTYGPEAYPGDDYVDLVSLDVYHEPWKGDPQLTDDTWERRYLRPLRLHRDFAISRGKPVSYAEWANGKIDQPDFIERMYAWFESLPDSGPGRLEYHSYFNPPKAAYELSGFPKSEAAYFRLFGGEASSPPPTTAPPTTAPATTAPATTAPATTAPVTTAPAPTGEQIMAVDQTVTHEADSPADLTLDSPWVIDSALVNGRALLRLDLLDKPTDLPVTLQLCGWSGGWTHATCASLGTYTEAGRSYVELKSPSRWWKSSTWNWNRAIDRMRLVVKDAASGSLLLSSSCGRSCYSGPSAPEAHAPITADLELLMVPRGATPDVPASWSGCPASFGPGCDDAAPTTTAPATTSPATTAPPTTAPATTAPVTTSSGELEISMREASAREGQNLVFKVVLNRAAPRDIEVQVRTFDGTAVAGDDYQAISRTVTIRRGEQRAFIGVPTKRDNRNEGTEQMRLSIVSASGVDIDIRSRPGSIRD
ncbi:MAG: glycosyl hydrolase [Ilumatobacter sp.]